MGTGKETWQLLLILDFCLPKRMKKLTAFCLCWLCFLFAKADTFIVTSNADSGPGSLREAITLANANGTSVMDFIHFAVPDQLIAGRTIALQTVLPDLRSNLVIDGSTQPGTKIGVSDAKIRITTATGIRMEYVFRIIDQKNHSFFGLHIDNIISPFGSFTGGRAIAVMNAENLTIGGIGKGNYFTRLQVVVDEADLQRAGKGITTNLVMKSNILNLSEDGNSMVSTTLAFTLENLRNLELGGENEAEGNYMSTGGENIAWTYTDSFAHMNLGTYKILNNKLGCNYAQTAALKCGFIHLRNGNSYGYTDTTNIIVKGNHYNAGAVVGTNWLQGFLKIQNKKGFIDIKANKIGLLNSDQQFFFSSMTTPIQIAGCENGIVGGNQAMDTNYVAGSFGYAISLGDNKAIQITKNSFYCNSNGIRVNSSLLPIPKTKIFVITDYSVSGTTLPNSRVEVFLTKLCTGCDNGKTYLGSAMADAAGDWSFTSPVLLDGAVTATGTSPQNNTGEFAKPEYTFDNFLEKYPTCGQKNGSIKGIRFVGGTKFYWAYSYLGNRDTFYTEDIVNLGPGTYTFVVEQGKYCSVKYTRTLSDLSPKINSQGRNIVQPSCGLNNGRILNHSLSGTYNKVYWKDASGAIVGNQSDLLNVGPGQYKLVILDTTYGCGDSTAFYTLTNQSGPSLNTAAAQITPSVCGNNGGSITGITASNFTGTPVIRWVDSMNNLVGNTLDLVNIPAGRYRLKFKDGGNCDTIITSFYTVPNNGDIQIDTTARIISPAKCSGTGGSIRDIKVASGTIYEWRNVATNTIVSTTIDALNLPAGNYQLTVRNNFGCTKTSVIFTVPQANFIPFGISFMKTYLAFCGLPNGSIRPETFIGDTSQYSFRWVDSSTNQTIGYYTQLYGIYGGTYQLFATDSNGCEKMIRQTTIINAPVPDFDYQNMHVKPDNCLSGKGAISGIVVNDLRNGVATYAWLNSVGDSIGNTVGIQNLPAGSYRLKVTDIMGCSVVSRLIDVGNQNTPLQNALYDDQQILKNSAATLTVNNFRLGRYDLFDDPAASQPIQSNTTGVFQTSALVADKVFYIRFTSGICSSELVPVKITVVDKTSIYVPTAFTPNNDGKNDQLRVVAHGRVKLHHFTVFNRWGEVMFSSSDLARGWDGTLRGVPAAGGVYVWILKVTDELTGNVIEQKGTVTIIR